MKKVMLSQPMANKSNGEIRRVKAKATEYLNKNGYEIIDSFFTDEWADQKNLEEKGVLQIPVHFMAKSLEKMSYCDAVYFCEGWEEARGCKIEHTVAKVYGLEIIYG